MNPKRIFAKYKLPQCTDLESKITNTIEVLKNEPALLRPLDDTDCAGAFLDLASFNNSIPVVLVPDLHARFDFFNEILNFSYQFDEKLMTIQEALAEEKVCVVCVGDGLHSERRGYERWQQAQKDWLKGKTVNDHMCLEMEDGLTLMSSIMDTKQNYPNYFHFLKGNHENILNTNTSGNLPFRKFAAEGEMVKDFMLTLYGRDITKAYANFELNLPLFVRGENFLVSHAEPIRAFSKDDLINAYFDDSIITGLTWTRCDEAEDTAVKTMLDTLLPDTANSVYFAGHRTVTGTHRALRDGKFIQIHNPNEHYISIVHPQRAFNPLTDIYNTKTNQRAES